MKKLLLYFVVIAVLSAFCLPFCATESIADAEALLRYVPYSAHETVFLENNAETRKTDAFIWAFIQEAVDELGIDVKDHRYTDALSDGIPGVVSELPAGEILYSEDQLQDIMLKMYNTEELTFNIAEYKTIYVPYEIGGFLYDGTNGKFLYRNLSYQGGDFGNLYSYEYSKLIDYQVSGDELYIYERYAVLYKTENMYYIYGLSDRDGFYPDQDHSDMYEIAVGEARSSYSSKSNIHLDPVYNSLFSGQMDDDLATYKHTYKKNENGDWYWSCSELINVGNETIPNTSDACYIYSLLSVCSALVIAGILTVRQKNKE